MWDDSMLTDLLSIAISPLALPCFLVAAWKDLGGSRAVFSFAFIIRFWAKLIINLAISYGVAYASHCLWQSWSWGPLAPAIKYDAVIIFFLLCLQKISLSFFRIFLLVPFFLWVNFGSSYFCGALYRVLPPSENLSEFCVSTALIVWLLFVYGMWYIHFLWLKIRSVEAYMNIVLSILVLGFGLGGFFCLPPYQATLWFLFVLVAYPVALAFTKGGRAWQAKDLIALYKVGVAQIPFIGGLLSAFFTTRTPPDQKPPIQLPPNDSSEQSKG